MWKSVGKEGAKVFFCGAHNMKLDAKHRLVLPAEFRYGLVHEGKLDFAVALGFGGCLTIYKSSVINDMMEKLSPHKFVPELQSFFTIFFGSLERTTCDKLGRVKLSSQLKQVLGKEKDIVVVGVFDKIEIWPKSLYDKNMEKMMKSENLASSMEHAFALMNGKKDETANLVQQTEQEKTPTQQETLVSADDILS